MMKILITGGLGYIGTNLYYYFERNKPDFICEICDHKTGMRLAHELEERDFDYDAVVHLAALSGIIACEGNPRKAVQDNMLTAENMFKLATKKNIPVVFTSSQAVKNPTSSVYAFMKWSCEQLADIYNRKGGKNYILRLGNVYGGDLYLDRKNTVVKQFVTKYRNKEQFEIDGDGLQERDFVNVLDVCDAITKTIEVQPNEKDPMDIGTGVSTSILKLATMFPWERMQFRKNRSAGVSSSIADTKTAYERIGFKATRKLEDYIKGVINEKM